MLRVIDAYLRRQSNRNLLLIALLQSAVLGYINHIIAPEISFSIFYVAPILFATWYISRSAGFGISVIAALEWLSADMMSGQEYSSVLIPFWNAGVRLGFFLVITYLTS